MSVVGAKYTAGYCAAVVERYEANLATLEGRLKTETERAKLAEFNALVADTATEDVKDRWAKLLNEFLVSNDASFMHEIAPWFARLDGLVPDPPPSRRGGRRSKAATNGDGDGISSAALPAS